MRRAICASAIAMALLLATGSMAGEISVERGLKVSIVSGCHLCHTEGYTGRGKIDPEKALRGNRLGFRGPWGTTYAANLRIRAQTLTEDGFVLFLSTLETSPPMPRYDVRAMDETDMRSLYRYIKTAISSRSAIPARRRRPRSGRTWSRRRLSLCSRRHNNRRAARETGIAASGRSAAHSRSAFQDRTRKKRINSPGPPAAFGKVSAAI